MNTQLALNSEIYSPVELSDGKAPAWVELIPAGPTVKGRDGRDWIFDAACAADVQFRFTSRAIDLPIDWEHATQHRAPKGQDAPAGAWIKQLEVRDDGALWGQVEWTPRAALQVENREYRFLSPVFDYDPQTHRIVHLVSAGLTNKPNFLLTALNQDTPHPQPTETPPVQLPAALLAALGLPETATPEQAITAVTELKTTTQALNSEHSNLDRFVPRGDYDVMQNRAANAEQQLTEFKNRELENAVDQVMTAATQSGKVTPATIEYHRSMCQDHAGLERFKAYVAAAPVIGGSSGLDNKPPSPTTTALNAEEQAMCVQLGVDPAEFAQNKQSEA